MNWLLFLIPVALLVALMWFKRSGQLPAKPAIEYLKNGALLIDVRSGGEFAAGHLPRAINLPHDRIESLLPERVHEKRQPLLLYCQSGMRSAVARKKLRRIGYTQVFDLGSYARATDLVKAAL
jgi:rhodanese-related sulfurtransferase